MKIHLKPAAFFSSNSIAPQTEGIDMRPRFYVVYFSLFILLIGFSQGFSGNPADIQRLEPEAHHRRVEQIITQLLFKKHYKKTDLDDSLSVKIYNNYIDALDGNRMYFLDSDLKSFEDFRLKMDDLLKVGKLEIPFEIYNRFRLRFDERMEYVMRRLDLPFDFTSDEKFYPDRTDLAWAESAAELNEIWQLRLKNDYLSLKLNDKADDKIRETLKKRYENIVKRVHQYRSEDVFQFYMNALAESFDPHTNYFSPRAKENFNISMSNALEGIGALLSSEDDYTKIVEIIPGGPADKSGILKAEDRIIGVAQGADGEFVDVIGWRIDDVVQLIRGPRQTIVRLQILAAADGAGARPRVVELVRDKVILADSAAESDTLSITEGDKEYKVGVITIPKFYFDFEAMSKGDPNFQSTSRDVTRLLNELKSAGVEGIIIDLRNNGGGFLSEAISLTGLFIDQGPVVQVRDMDNKIKVENDFDSGVVYDGPLAVLVNRFSASASEIFAAAIQDYQRGLILGEQTFGKGTVQTAMDLNKYFPGSEEQYGQLKYTIAKFYRINGGSTQHLGVIPDIEFPEVFQPDEVGEGASPNALLWDEINRVQFNKLNPKLGLFIPRLEKEHAVRVNENSQFQDYLEKIHEMRSEREKKWVSLNEAERRKERETTKPKDESTGAEDVVLDESARILADFVLLSAE